MRGLPLGHEAGQLEVLRAHHEHQRAHTRDAAEAALKARATELRQQKSGIQTRRDGASQAVREDIDRLVAVYDQMKPAEAAAVLTNLPPDFAAEILMRVRPEAGARIIAAVEPRQAALLTAQMGARSARND